MAKVIDIHETNFGLGNHRTWPRADRVAWHAWAAEVSRGPHPIEECDCNALED